jgi:hypothetical protein
MAGYLNLYSDIGSLFVAAEEYKAKLALSKDPRDVKRLSNKLDETVELLLEAVAGLPNSQRIEQVMDDISFSSLPVVVEEIRDLRGKLKACEAAGKQVDATRIARELASLEAAVAKICVDERNGASTRDATSRSFCVATDQVRI